MTTTVTIRGIDKLAKKLSRVGSNNWAKRGLNKAGTHVKGIVAKYPQATSANSPSNFSGRWYERGYGPRWIRKKSGRVGGRKTSETLGRKWTIRKTNAGLTVIVGNNVSYGPFVQDEKKQARFHKRRKWPTIQRVAKDERKTVIELLEQELNAELK